MSLLQELGEAVASKRPEEIRNVCLIAHVDHGKTSLADSLVSANAVISSRMAGRLRFMDSREDEQTRGITMKSSGISLLCGPLLLNLMDSPGHVDFSSEVTSALLVSDIALLLVDAVEGVCSQTEALLRQAITNGQSIILVINKLDRLVVELKMSPSEAYQHLIRLLEATNSCVSQVVAGIVIEGDTFEDIEKIEKRLHFEPVKGNVLFSSALHGYAFSVEDFAEIYAERLQLEKKTLLSGLFGDFYFQAGAVKEGAGAKGKRTLFEQLVLEPLWALHECGLVKNDIAKLLQLAEKLGVPFKSRRVEDAFDEVMRQWMPVARACFRACARAPSAKLAFSNEHRLRLLLGKGDAHPLYESIKNCAPDGDTVLAVVKFIRFEDEKLAICRVLSGRVAAGNTLFVTGAKKVADEEEIPTTVIDKVFILRGRDCIPVESASAGCICAISARDIVQNSTLCSKPVHEGLDLGREMGEPLVRVSVNTAELDQMDELRRTLKLLTVLDPSLRVLELETGELTMVTAGEVHLQKCLKDLEDMGISDLEVSAPIVPFLETVVPDPLATAPEIVEKVTECRLRGEALCLRLRTAPLPIEVVTLLDKSRDLLLEISRGQVEEKESQALRNKLMDLCMDLLPQMKGAWWYRMGREEIGSLIDKIWSFGPDKARANILFNCIPDYDRGSVWRKESDGLRPFDQALVSGFQLFVGKGPLCDEAMRGVAVLIEGWSMDENDSAVGGQMISAMRATCKAATEKLGTLRLVAAMYRCIVATASQALGKVHSVLAQRKAKVVSEDINEATGLFEVEALLPIVESFSFCDHLRTSTSGMASAQLEFSHWEVIEEDPYWQPSTLEEIEEFGLKGDSPNHARGYMDAVRKRKGLPTEDLIVVSAEKQRNMKRNR